jgi:uncharacterized protein YbjQ (UPF0145 family)
VNQQLPSSILFGHGLISFPSSRLHAGYEALSCRASCLNLEVFCQPDEGAVRGRSASYERELNKAREIALQELEEEASKTGANAVVGGVDLDYEVVGQGGSMLMVSISGTAVKLS